MNANRFTNTLTSDQCWEAVANRDGSADGQFVYGVHSTRVYCRPSCPSRRPKREGVSFFLTGEEAARSGYRPCKRCQPDLQTVDEIEWVKQVCALIDANIGSLTTLDYLGVQLSISPGHLQKVFKRVMGITPRQYAEARRRERFKDAIRTTERITDSIFDAGYGSHSSPYEGTGIGMSPKDYQKGGAGALVQFTVQPCTLGYVLVAATARGVCAVRLGDTPQTLESELHDEFPNAVLFQGEVTTDQEDRAKSGFDHYAKIAIGLVEGQNIRADLPLDIRATAFQEQVWRALRTIPLGETRSYKQVAEAIGQPTAVRAVAHACATNPVAVVVPCHRVIRSDGDLGGYRWGLARKEALLEREGAVQTVGSAE